MNLSSSCITHFTGNIATVEKLLAGNIYGSYCRELLNSNNEVTPIFVPMISFCDIPIKTYSNIGAPYGKFGIGLSKEWAIKNKLTPVLYIDKNSRLLDNFITALKSSLTTVNIAGKILKENKKNAPITKNLTKSVEYLTYSLYHTKHYEDELKRGEYVDPNYRFYDEREWRYIPEFDCAVCELSKTEEEYQEWRNQSDEKPLLKEVHLTFSPEDIAIIIFENNNQREQIVELIKKSPMNFENFSKELLLTKIQSFEDIERII